MVLSASGLGMMEMETPCSVSRRQVIWVAYRVQSPAARGKENPVKLSRTELFPEDWSPTTTSCGSGTKEPTFSSLSLSILDKMTWLPKPMLGGRSSIMLSMVLDMEARYSGHAWKFSSSLKMKRDEKRKRDKEKKRDEEQKRRVKKKKRSARAAQVMVEEVGMTSDMRMMAAFPKEPLSE